MLNKEPTKGRLLQVATGEGKSSIISIFAAVMVLKGNKVDVVTSSPVLAQRDAEDKKGFL
jgi:preprotein translocase subunit SecA